MEDGKKLVGIVDDLERQSKGDYDHVLANFKSFLKQDKIINRYSLEKHIFLSGYES